MLERLEVSIPTTFYFDPICPWAWITSRWVREVANLGLTTVHWRPISLLVLNSENYESNTVSEKAKAGHALGHKLLRVATGLEMHHDNSEVGRFYQGVGAEIHIAHNTEGLRSPKGLELWLKEHDFDPALASCYQDSSYDHKIIESTEAALTATGKEVGTPILTLNLKGREVSYFGPVISEVPRGEDAERLWHAFVELCRFDNLYEIKRAVRKAPMTDS